METALALEPTSKKNRSNLLSVSPSGYEDLPEDQRPTFYFRRLSFRQFREIANWQDELEASKTANTALDMMMKVLKPSLVDWKNVTDDEGNAIPFDVEKLEDVISMADADELAGLVAQGGMTKRARKN